MIGGMTPLSKTFAALADDTRLSLVETLLQKGELPAGALSDTAPISAPAISRHLRVLQDAGLVRRRVQGQQRIISLDPEALRPPDLEQVPAPDATPIADHERGMAPRRRGPRSQP